MNTLQAWNQALFLQINSSVLTHHWIVNLGIFCAKYLAVVVPIVLIGMWLSGDFRIRAIALRALTVTIVAFVGSWLIGLAWQSPRPFVLGLGHLLVQHAPTPSFPSNHVTAFSTVALTLLFARLKGLALVTALVGLAVAWGRIFVGVHYPLDMLGAIGLAFLAYVIVSPLWRSYGLALTRSIVVLYRHIFSLPIRKGWLRY
jgi:undecaprenyl-diphosphatase